ncbi:hypothetical protein MXB_2314 [Myxobolus squamalis]|nr:hypothetical protein MXB_2314 [Myxobolus squamalis]
MKLLKMESKTEIKQAVLYKVGDCQIDEYDVDCIANHDFLTDRTLLFFITYFYTKFAKEFKKKVEIISPEVVHLIKMLDAIDCGLYVILFAKKIFELLNDTGSIYSGILYDIVGDDHISREDLLNILKSLSDQLVENATEC